MEERIKTLEEKVERLELLISKLVEDRLKIRHNEFVGMEIKNFYCNGFFGRDYDLEGSKIIENTDKLLTIKKKNGEILQGNFEDGWDMREMVEEWTTESGIEDDEY